MTQHRTVRTYQRQIKTATLIHRYIRERDQSVCRDMPVFGGVFVYVCSVEFVA